MIGATASRKPLPEALPFSDKAFEIVRAGMNAVTNEPGGTAYGFRIAQPGSRWRARPALRRSADIEGRTPGRGEEERQPGVEICATLRYLHRVRAGAQQPDTPAPASPSTPRTDIPRVVIARDVLLFAQQRNVLGLRTAYPVSAASAGQPVGRT